ncbi:uncharacterized protein LOC122808817 [Protopterus annectens]|uniref:uncharacterized protein LOC122808817 n=1 Tax=Protopterus annectens TaxID=7888 RepID=UPI001CFC0474|nr:uncharacterized protein LOC122808817 [Protopterus annectens]
MDEDSGGFSPEGHWDLRAVINAPLTVVVLLISLLALKWIHNSTEDNEKKEDKLGNMSEKDEERFSTEESREQELQFAGCTDKSVESVLHYSRVCDTSTDGTVKRQRMHSDDLLEINCDHFKSDTATSTNKANCSYKLEDKEYVQLFPPQQKGVHPDFQPGQVIASAVHQQGKKSNKCEPSEGTNTNAAGNSQWVHGDSLSLDNTEHENSWAGLDSDDIKSSEKRTAYKSQDSNSMNVTYTSITLTPHTLPSSALDEMWTAEVLSKANEEQIPTLEPATTFQTLTLQCNDVQTSAITFPASTHLQKYEHLTNNQLPSSEIQKEMDGKKQDKNEEYFCFSRSELLLYHDNREMESILDAFSVNRYQNNLTVHDERDHTSQQHDSILDLESSHTAEKVLCTMADVHSQCSNTDYQHLTGECLKNDDVYSACLKLHTVNDISETDMLNAVLNSTAENQVNMQVQLTTEPASPQPKENDRKGNDVNTDNAKEVTSGETMNEHQASFCIYGDVLLNQNEASNLKITKNYSPTKKEAHMENVTPTLTSTECRRCLPDEMVTIMNNEGNTDRICYTPCLSESSKNKTIECEDGLKGPEPKKVVLITVDHEVGGTSEPCMKDVATDELQGIVQGLLEHGKETEHITTGHVQQESNSCITDMVCYSKKSQSKKHPESLALTEMVRPSQDDNNVIFLSSEDPVPCKSRNDMHNENGSDSLMTEAEIKHLELVSNYHNLMSSPSSSPLDNSDTSDSGYLTRNISPKCGIATSWPSGEDSCEELDNTEEEELSTTFEEKTKQGLVHLLVDSDSHVGTETQVAASGKPDKETASNEVLLKQMEGNNGSRKLVHTENIHEIEPVKISDILERDSNSETIAVRCEIGSDRDLLNSITKPHLLEHPITETNINTITDQDSGKPNNFNNEQYDASHEHVDMTHHRGEKYTGYICDNSLESPRQPEKTGDPCKLHEPDNYFLTAEGKAQVPKCMTSNIMTDCSTAISTLKMELQQRNSDQDSDVFTVQMTESVFSNSLLCGKEPEEIGAEPTEKGQQSMQCCLDEKQAFSSTSPVTETGQELVTSTGIQTQHSASQDIEDISYRRSRMSLPQTACTGLTIPNEMDIVWKETKKSRFLSIPWEAAYTTEELLYKKELEKKTGIPPAEDKEARNTVSPVTEKTTGLDISITSATASACCTPYGSMLPVIEITGEMENKITHYSSNICVHNMPRSDSLPDNALCEVNLGNELPSKEVLKDCAFPSDVKSRVAALSINLSGEGEHMDSGSTMSNEADTLDRHQQTIKSTGKTLLRRGSISAIADNSDFIMWEEHSPVSPRQSSSLWKSCDSLQCPSSTEKATSHTRARSALCLLMDSYLEQDGKEGLVEIIARGSFIQVPENIQATVDAMMLQLNLGNCMELLAYAKKHKVDDLKKAAYRVMSVNYLQALKNSSIYSQLNAYERDVILQMRSRGKKFLGVADVENIYGLKRANWSSSSPDLSVHSLQPFVNNTSDEKAYLHIYYHHEDRWHPLTKIPEEANLKGCGICSMHNYLFLAGGIEGSGPNARCSNKVFCYNPLTNIWSKVQSMIQARSQFKLVPVDGLLYAIGGECLYTMERYDPRADRWTFRASLPKGTFAVAHEATCCNGEIYVSGGNLFYRLLKYSPCTDSWDECPYSSSRKRSSDMVAVRNFIYRFDVHRDTGISVSQYNALAKSWQECTTLCLKNLCPFRCALLDNAIYCVNKQMTVRFAADEQSPHFEPGNLQNFSRASGTLFPFCLILPERTSSQTAV